MKKLLIALAVGLLLACGDGLTGPDTSEIPGYYVINYHIEFDFHIGLHPPYAHVGDLVLHDDRTLEIYLHTCIWDECQEDEGEGTWQRRGGSLRICSDPSVASTPWLYGLEVQDESCLTFFWEECHCDGEPGTWDTRDLDPGPGVKRWLSLDRAVTIA